MWINSDDVSHRKGKPLQVEVYSWANSWPHFASNVLLWWFYMLTAKNPERILFCVFIQE